MWIVAGLGNPGPEYAPTRHNAGFWVLERLARDWRARLRRNGASQSELVACDTPFGERVVLCRPLTFMNESGRALARVLRTQSAPPDRLIVVHDDLDLPPGALRLREGGGTGGHHGLESIAALVGPGFGRVRVGIGRPAARHEDAILRWVLGVPSPEDRAALDAAVDRAAKAVETVIGHGWEAAMNRFNRSAPPFPERG